MNFRKVIFFCSCLLLGACSENYQNKFQSPPDIKVENMDSTLKKIENTWFYKKKKFSGYMVEKEKDGRIVYQLPIIGGKENGIAIGWYNSGEKLLERIFIDGKKEREFRQWWPNGNLRYIFHYKNDLFDGVQLVFFPNGKRREENNYLLGEKEGIQRVLDKNGSLISNYTIKNKKKYGVISVKSCLPTGH